MAHREESDGVDVGGTLAVPMLCLLTAETVPLQGCYLIRDELLTPVSVVVCSSAAH